MASIGYPPTPIRAGLLIPSSNTTVEHEYNRFGAPELSWHAGRLTFTTITPQALAAQDKEMLAEAAKLATAKPDVLLICQSAIGFMLGAAYERDLAGRLRSATGVPTLSLAALMTEALHALGIRRIALATPFPSGIDTATAAYLRAAGLDVVRMVSLGLSGNFALAGVPAERLVQLAQSADAPGVEAVVIPGGNLRTLAILDAMEEALGKPVLTTNQVGLWAVAGAFGLTSPLPGRLAAADADALRRRRLLFS